MNLKTIVTNFALPGADVDQITMGLRNAIAAGGKAQCPAVLRLVGGLSREEKIKLEGFFKALTDAEAAGTLFADDAPVTPEVANPPAVPTTAPQAAPAAPTAVPAAQPVATPTPVHQAPAVPVVGEKAPVVVEPQYRGEPSSTSQVTTGIEAIHGISASLFQHPRVIDPFIEFLRKLANGLEAAISEEIAVLVPPVLDVTEPNEPDAVEVLVPEPTPEPVPEPEPSTPTAHPVGNTTVDPIWAAVSSDVKTVFDKKDGYSAYERVIIPITLLWRRPSIYLWRFLAMYSGQYTEDAILELCTGGEKVAPDTKIERFGGMTFRAIKRQLRDMKNDKVEKMADAGWSVSIDEAGVVYVKPREGFGVVDGDSIY